MFTTINIEKKVVTRISSLLLVFLITMGCGGPPLPISPIVLKVGDKIPPFDHLSIGIPVKYTGGTLKKVSGEAYQGPLIEISKNATFTHPKNGKRYTCITDGGCIIHMEKFVILRGARKPER